MEGISSWIAALAAVSFIVSIISVIAPKNSAGRVASMLGSILVLVALVSPIFDFEGAKLLGMGKVYEEKISERIETAEEKTADIKNNIIQEKLAAYVLEKAKTDENECKVSVEVSDGAVLSATIECHERGISDRVLTILENELGIAKESVEIKDGKEKNEITAAPKISDEI